MITSKLLIEFLTITFLQLVFDIRSQVSLSEVELGNQDQNGGSDFVYRSYQSTIYCNPSSAIQFPKNVAQVQAIVVGAINTGKTVKAFGSRHSTTDTICTDGIPVSMTNVNYTIINDDGTATFGAGIELQDAMIFLEQNNKSLIHLPAFSGITIGGAIGTGAHGSSLLHPTSISDQIVSLTIVDGTGKIRVINSPDDLKAFRVNLGLLGLIIDVTLNTVPLYKMTVENTLHSESILFDGTAINWAGQYDWFEMWWFPTTQDLVVSKGNFTQDLTILGNASTNFLPDENPVTIFAAQNGLETLQALRNLPGLYAIEQFTKFSLYEPVVGKPPIFSEDGVTLANPATGYGWRLMANKCTNNCAWKNGNTTSVLPEESSIAMDISNLPYAIQTIKNVRQSIPAPFPMIGVMIRFCRPSDGLMAISSGRQTVSLEWIIPMRRDRYNTARDSAGAYQQILLAFVGNLNGRCHWGKNGLYFHSKNVINQTSPNLQAFVAAMDKFDPNGIFMNKFGRRIRGQANDLDIDPLVTHCALQDYCVCKTSWDCATGQFCSNKICRDLLTLAPLPLLSYDPKNLTSILLSISLLKP